MVLKIFKTLILGIFIFCTTLTPGFFLSEVLANSRIERLEHKLNLARSDFLESSRGWNGAIRKSAERQYDKVLADIAAEKNGLKNQYDKMVRRLNQIYTSLLPYFKDPSAGKAFLDAAMGYVPVVGNAYGVANTIYSYADKMVQNKEAREIFDRAKKQIKEIDKVSEEYNEWAEFEKRVQAEKARLQRQFDKGCVGKRTYEWRYDTEHGVFDQAGITDTGLTGNDAASGRVFTGTVRNNTGDTITTGFPPGTITYPENTSSQRMIITGPPGIIIVPPGGIITFPLDGFCLDPNAHPPSPLDSPGGIFIGPPLVFIPDGNPFNHDFTGIPNILIVVPSLLGDGTIVPTGLPPQAELETMIQWLIWSILENFDKEDGEQRITEQVEQSGGVQTPEQIQQLNENIWGGINLVKKKTRQEAIQAPIFEDGFESGDTSSWSNSTP